MTILIVDDEEIVHKLIRVTLKGFGDIVFLVAKEGTEALNLLMKHCVNIDLLISEVVMLGRINGIKMPAQL
jgi:CheY-like chemotaxis protein